MKKRREVWFPFGNEMRLQIRKMKLTSILLFIVCVTFGNSFSQVRLTVHFDKTDIRDVLQTIEGKTDYIFLYKDLIFDFSRKVTAEFNDAKFEEVLKSFCDQTKTLYEIRGRQIILTEKAINTIQIDQQPQNVEITGKVTDLSGAPLPGLTVLVKGTTSGTITDGDGNYSLSNVPGNATLVFSFVGMKSQELSVTGKTNINVKMEEEAIGLDEVIAVGYGTQKRKNMIGSVGQVTGEQLANRPVPQLSSALTGQLAGVTITQRNGRPGSESGAIRIRGVGSFGADASALILVDGIPVGGFNDIDPNDVQSISILKDASSAAIYGARAANGVILVTTKSGSEGKTKISINSYVGFQKPTALPQYVNSWEFAIGLNEAGGAFTEADIEKLRSGSEPDSYPNTDYLNAIITKNGIQTSHSIGISGGSKTTQYNLSFGYLFQDGVVIKNNYSRYNVRLNLTTELSPKLLLTTRIASINSNVNEPMSPISQTVGLLDIIDLAARIPSTFVGRLSNGDYGLGINLNGTPISQIASESFSKAKDLNLNGTVRLDYKIIAPLKLSFISSYAQSYGSGKQFQATQRLNPTVLVGPSQLTERSNNNIYYTMQGLVEYTKLFGKHQVNVLGGYSFESNKAENISAFRDNLPNNTLTVINIASPNNQQSKGTGSEYAIESEFGRANYSYAGKYLVEGVIRRDGSSRFPTNEKYAYFPSIAIGWRIGEEKFIKENYPWISELKLKTSRGVLGNQSIGNYAYQDVLEISSTNLGGTNYSFGDVIKAGTARTTITDNTIHWESTRTTDVGLEIGVFKNSLSGSVTYFNRYTYDILVSPGASVSKVLGFGLSVQNSGKLENKGWEFTLNYNKKVGEVGFNVNTNFSIINNKALDLGVGNIIQPNGMVGNGNNLFIGYPIEMYYGFLADGLFVDQADIDAWPKMTSVNAVPKPGDIRYKDISGPDGIPDGKVDNTYDRTYLGSQIPKFTYGANLGANYKGFDFNVLLQGITGVKGYLNNNFGYAFYNNGNLQRWQFDGRWTVANPDRNAIYPRLEQVTNAGTPNTVNSSFWTLKGSYLRIKNMQFGYTLPKTLLQKAKISNVRLYVSGENLHTFSNYRKGWDPEINTGTNFYPILSNYTFGINANF